MEFDSDWMTLGKHRVRLRCVRGFPTEKARSIAEVAKIAIENNLSAAARLVEVTADGEKAYTISVGTTFPKDRAAATQLELALATMFGLKPEQVNFEVVVVSQAEVDLHFGVYERMLAEKLGIVPPIQ
ncbi:conserved hypothetical protein [Cupriavidus taiwanensis]|uniref:Uncharacterized protein n=1 Tax=Cupriavidus taiwanensis TaxID=164546 RepID=A0A976ATZ6_9BURK|nr:hypothetical protein [Cupriavidus taiwanensis]SOZ50647.1 conserved hypothetical protein [Cupriavidus taiwanensis]SOZ52098.1 conserved hypothetical protein [Cupriavidus taiwanensis]SOZ54516.1 conserved hypothetical protein [Cupriavidus taiwanensis]SPA00648.1 conserved hypothetical protein [Cupriavidus taiwanensis]SPA04308.1 conserved hypothetical protein [Cupriavidus taiwanensis]